MLIRTQKMSLNLCKHLRINNHQKFINHQDPLKDEMKKEIFRMVRRDKFGEQLILMKIMLSIIAFLKRDQVMLRHVLQIDIVDQVMLQIEPLITNM